MKKILWLIIICCTWSCSFAQTPSYQERLYYTCKVWGFVKYYHSNVSMCNVNWDSVLIATMPLIKAAATKDEFNDALDTMLKQAGPMAIASTPLPDTIPAELKRNRNFAWIADTVFRSDVRIILDTIKNNFRPHSICWVKENDYSTSYNSYLMMHNDSIELNVNTTTAFPDEFHKQLQFFKYWNIVNYFYPYNYILDKPWDTTLFNYTIPIDTVSNAYSLYLLYEKIASALSDEHTQVLTYSTSYFPYPGGYLPRIRLRYMNNEYVVIKSQISSIKIGDAILSIDGLTTKQWEDSLRQYISAGNNDVFRKIMCDNILGRKVNGTVENLIIEDSLGHSHNINVTCTSTYYSDFIFYGSDYYPADSLTFVSWTTLPCDIGYVNMSNITETDVDAMYDDLRGKSAIIFDFRPNITNQAISGIVNHFLPNIFPFANLMIPDLTYPGTYSWQTEYSGIATNPTPYKGKVLLLINEEAASHDEFDCMALSVMPGAIKIGSNTAGADGNISFWNLSQDLATGFTTLGVFYPDKSGTQRVGITPDSVIYPTKEGIRAKRDELLEKAMTIAGCKLATPIIESHINDAIKVFPNPTNSDINIKVHGNYSVLNLTLIDLVGQEVIQKNIISYKSNSTISLNTSSLQAGMYILKIETANQIFTTRILKVSE